jgi:hypothetical protein
MPDIATRLRQTRANMIGTDDEQHYWDCYDAAAAIERLRLTDEEREAISRVYDLLCDRSRELQSATRLDEARPLIQWAKTLQGLWERLSGSAAISGAGKSAPAANTPLTLTDAEREAIAYYIGTGGPDTVDATLRTILERTK